MDLVTFLRVVRQQWLVVLIGLLAATAGTYVAYRKLPPSYQATGTLVLVPPATTQVTQQPPPQPSTEPAPPSVSPSATRARVKAAPSPAAATPAPPPQPTATPQTITNSYTQLGSNYRLLAQLLADYANSDTFQAQMTARGASRFDVKPGSDVPTIAVTTDDSNSNKAMWTAQVVLQAVDSRLAQLQAMAGVPSPTLVKSMLFISPDHAKPTSAKLKVTAMVGVVSVAGVLTLAFALQGLAGARRRRLEDSSRRSALDWGLERFDGDREQARAGSSDGAVDRESSFRTVGKGVDNIRR